MPENLPTSQVLIDGIIAVIVAILAYGITSLIAYRRDVRTGKVEDVDLFSQVKKAAAEQMADMRIELAETRAEMAANRLEVSAIRARLDRSEERSDERGHQLDRLRIKFNISIDHMSSLEAAMRSQGLVVPLRPVELKDLV